MRLIWCPETATKAYIDAVKALSSGGLEDRSVAELVAAMAGGWNAQLIVEACGGAGATTSVGLAAAARHTRGRHVRVVPDERTGTEYAEAMRGTGEKAAEVAVGEAAEVMGGLEGVDFVVVDHRSTAAEAVVIGARPGERGMVVVCKNAAVRRREGAVGEGRRVVRSAFLPIGGGLEVLHVGVGRGPRLGGCRRWIKHVDRDTGEEHVFRR